MKEGSEFLLLCIYEKTKIHNIKSFLRYVVLRFQNSQRELTYRIYVSDTLQIIAENTARMVENGKYPTKRYYDVSFGKAPKEEKAEEIINKYKTLGLVV